MGRKRGVGRREEGGKGMIEGEEERRTGEEGRKRGEKRGG